MVLHEAVDPNTEVTPVSSPELTTDKCMAKCAPLTRPEGGLPEVKARRGSGALAGAVTRGSVMGGAGSRGARTDRRYTGVVDAAALASGEMNEAPLDDLGSLDARDSAQRAATHHSARCRWGTRA